MILKRPSFRRGGNAGIGSITPRVNARFGFGFLKKGIGGDKLFPTKTSTTPSYLDYAGSGIISEGMFREIFDKKVPIPKGSPYMGGVYAAAPIAAQTGIAYLNRPKTLEEKRIMQRISDENALSAEATMPSTLEEQDARRLEASEVGPEISFTDAIFMDPDTGTYPKIFGRSKDREI